MKLIEWFLDMIITCDENWLWQFDPKTKQQSSQWTERVGDLIGKELREIYVPINREYCYVKLYVSERVTVNSQYYVTLSNLLMLITRDINYLHLDLFITTKNELLCANTIIIR